MARGKRPPLPEGDDGRTIVDMNVDGMPWYTERRSAASPHTADGEPMTKEQSRAYTWAAVKAGLVVAAIFGAVFAIFIAFCDFVWFR